MRALPHPRFLFLALVVLGLPLVGCSRDDEQQRASQLAQQALGLEPGDKIDESVQEKVDVLVVEETRVIERATGRVLKTISKETPVQIVRQKKVTTDVNVGDTKAVSAETAPQP